MKWVESALMRELDKRCIESGTPGTVLMERAGFGVAMAVRRLAETMSGIRTPVTLVAGRGNNGGDAFVVARVLASYGFPVKVLRTSELSDKRGDAAAMLVLMRKCGLDAELRTDAEDWDNDSAEMQPFGGIVVDAVLGTGVTGAARGVAAAAIRWINRVSKRQRVVSVDLPSGMNADTGEAPGDTVRADLTVCMALPKVGLRSDAAVDFRGRVEIVDIGVTADDSDTLSAGEEFISAADVSGWMPRRDANSHKGSFGHLLVVGGSRGFCGAAALTARAACRSGVGLVTAAVPAEIHAIVASAAPEAMVHPLASSPDGGLTLASIEQWGYSVESFSTVVTGPGMMASNSTRAAVEYIISEASGTVVLDADALNVFASNACALNDGGCCKIITPHPGEAARLLGIDTADVQQNRIDTVSKLASVTGATVVLKGAGTLIKSPEGPIWSCLCGNPGMASGGSGDVLAGMIGALSSQGLAPEISAAAAVWLHSTAGDLAAWHIGEHALNASDIISRIPEAFLRVCAR